MDRIFPTVRIERFLRGASQAALAEQIGISQPFLSLIETGHRNPSRKTADSIAQVLGVPPEKLFTEVGE